jgi:hypothetical protein
LTDKNEILHIFSLCFIIQKEISKFEYSSHFVDIYVLCILNIVYYTKDLNKRQTLTTPNCIRMFRLKYGVYYSKKLEKLNIYIQNKQIFVLNSIKKKKNCT